MEVTYFEHGSRVTSGKIEDKSTSLAELTQNMHNARTAGKAVPEIHLQINDFETLDELIVLYRAYPEASKVFVLNTDNPAIYREVKGNFHKKFRATRVQRITKPPMRPR